MAINWTDRVKRYGLDLAVDIHGMRAYAAKCLLVQLLPQAARDRDAKALIVIHGFHAGTVLRDMVRKELRSPFIKERRPGMTDGQTILVLNKKKQGPYL